MSDGWNPVREEFFKRTLSRDFKTIYQRQLDIAERGIYREGRQLKVRFRPDKIVPGRTGHLRDRLAAAEFQITGVDPIMLETGYPLYIRFLDMREKRDLRIYNRQIWGIVYNNALPDLRAGMSDSLRKEIRNRLEKLFPWPDGNDSAYRSGYRPH